MAQRLPLDLIAEYRGMRPAGSFTRKETREVVETPARLKFELSLEDGDVETFDVAGSQLDRCQPPFDYSKLERGDIVRLRGFVVLQQRGSDQDSYASYTHAEIQSQPKVNGTLPQRERAAA